MSNAVRVRNQGYLTQGIEAGRHRLTADEPKQDGGQDRGPNPYELLLASLGACTAMTVQLYAKKKGWPLEGVEVELEQERIHAEDCANCETEDVRADRISKRLTVRGPLDETQRQRLAEIAERCPVNRTLTGHLEISIELVPADGPA
ncbi:MAG TPA: OsmC family protein [Chloroflexota bacterium]|nr:OsmC family protein [Chloroflexota bacterium]